MKNKPFVTATIALFIIFGVHGIARSQIVIHSLNELLQNKIAWDATISYSTHEGMYRLGVQQDKEFNLHAECKSQYNVTFAPSDVRIYTPIELFADKRYPSKGAWVVKYKFTRCGESKIYNALFVADPHGREPKFSKYYPGTTNASALLIKDAMISATMAAIAGNAMNSGNNDCKEAKATLFDMRVTEPAHDVVEGDKVFKGVWVEVWTFGVCGKMIDITMTFVPDATGGGTSFRAGPVKK